jgi:hypothetical protein
MRILNGTKITPLPHFPPLPEAARSSAGRSLRRVTTKMVGCGMFQIPIMEGLIRRRLLVNFRADPEAVQRLLPKRFRPKLHAGHAIIGICLIRLERIRPRWLPLPWGMASENGAHRIAVEWSEAEDLREGVYIARRDSGSWLNHLVGGRLFPGVHHLARFQVSDRDGRIDLHMRTTDGDVTVDVIGHETDALTAGSCFADITESSRFFEGGSVGWSPGRDAGILDGLRLQTLRWNVRPLAVEEAFSSWFADHLPTGSFEFDHALLMRDIPHEWHQEPQITLDADELGHNGAACC